MAEEYLVDKRHGRNIQPELPDPNGNLEKMDKMLMEWPEKVDAVRDIKEVMLDLDSSASPVYGEPAEARYNGYFGEKCRPMRKALSFCG